MFNLYLDLYVLFFKMFIVYGDKIEILINKIGSQLTFLSVTLHMTVYIRREYSQWFGAKSELRKLNIIK